MAEHDHPLTPDAIRLIATIEEAGSFAAAARLLGKVPSALSYSVRQLETALDVLLFDRSSRTAVLTPAGRELLSEGRRLLLEMDAVASRVKRVASGWEGQLTLAANALMCPRTLLDLVAAFLDQRDDTGRPPPTRLKLRQEVLSGTWEALLSGTADLAIGVDADDTRAVGIQQRPLGELRFVFAVAPHHPLAHGDGPLDSQALRPHRAVAIADSAMRLSASSRNLLPGQDVLTMPTLDMKIDAQLRGLGCGFLPEPRVRQLVADGRLVVRQTGEERSARFSVAWRVGAQRGRALDWWLQQLDSPRTRQALLEGVHR
ncbi:MAG: LysR family transcriptional regulator [Methyloversatilis sp.]|jgi:DNA-binding transcriptional LysR family regulator|nr:LysR family transcriptional regulator [Methyloversatilis sp.]MBP6192920.1 LysR family transcriptional regulator [Methyloversatilis sp.]MBP9117051.1 LysR family transcriptional regulator [Methyloversatilis sp.]